MQHSVTHVTDAYTYYTHSVWRVPYSKKNEWNEQKMSFQLDMTSHTILVKNKLYFNQLDSVMADNLATDSVYMWNLRQSKNITVST